MEVGTTPTRTWKRYQIEQTYLTGDFASATSGQIIQVVDSAGPDDTMVRILLDIMCTVSIDDTSGGGPDKGWWTGVHPMVAVGRGEIGEPALAMSTFVDERVTGTDMLYLTEVGTLLPPQTEHYGYYRLLKTLDSHGMRKPENPGTPPFGLVTVKIAQQTLALDDSFIWRVLWYGYIRVLWETP